VEFAIAKEDIEKQIKVYVQEKQFNEAMIEELQRQRRGLRIVDIDSKQMNIPCTVESCKGFCIDQDQDQDQLECGICKTKICKLCLQSYVYEAQQTQTHTCDPDILASMALIKHDTKPCPKCAIATIKIDGCNQMWCTQCKTTWDWNSGQVESGRIHNPHYYEYQRMNAVNAQHAIPRENGDVLCGGFPTIYEIEECFLKCKVLQKDAVIINSIHQAVSFYENIYMPMYANNEYTPDTYTSLRVDFMRNKIPEAVFIKKLQYQEKARIKKVNISQIMQTFLTVATEIFISLNNCNTSEEIMAKMSEMEQIRKYSNEQLHAFSAKYDCPVPILDDYYNISREKNNKRIRSH